MMGIYLIKNCVNNKIYIGSSQNIERRFYLHKHSLNKNNHTNEHLQNAWNLYGEESFNFSILETVQDKQLLLEKEKLYIIQYNSINRENGYNICEDTKAPMRNRKHSEISKEKMTNSKLGLKNSFFGKSHTDETKELLRKKMKGRVLSHEHKEKVIKAGHKNGENNINAKLTTDLVNKIREEFANQPSKYGLYKKLSNIYGVSKSTIRRIVENKTYKEVSNVD